MSGLSPVGFVPRPSADIAHATPHCLFPVLIYSQLGLFLCDPFSQGLPRAVCLVPGFERAIRSWIPAELSKAAALPAWCTIKDHERQFHNVITGLIVLETIIKQYVNRYKCLFKFTIKENARDQYEHVTAIVAEQLNNYRKRNRTKMKINGIAAQCGCS